MNRPPILHPSVLCSPKLRAAGFEHGFFTRVGGASPAPFASLNFASGDTNPELAQNLEIAARVLGVASAKIYMPTQVHGVVALRVDGHEDPEEFRTRQGDTVSSSQPDLACAVRSADCVPVLLGCLDTGLVAAVHAGWKGCVLGVIPAGVDALRAAGATRLVAAIGPHISAAAFEVSEDVADELLAASPDKSIVDRSRAKPHVDLRKMARAQLSAQGVEQERIDDVSGCTVLEPERFYSFRREREYSGRLLSAIVARTR